MTGAWCSSGNYLIGNLTRDRLRKSRCCWFWIHLGSHHNHPLQCWIPVASEYNKNLWLCWGWDKRQSYCVLFLYPLASLSKREDPKTPMDGNWSSSRTTQHILIASSPNPGWRMVYSGKFPFHQSVAKKIHNDKGGKSQLMGFPWWLLTFRIVFIPISRLPTGWTWKHDVICVFSED